MGNLSEYDKLRCQKRLNQLNNYGLEDLKYGVFITNDLIFDTNTSKDKTRRVVIINQNKNNIDVVPVKRNNNIVLLEKVDNANRYIHKKSIKKIHINNLYEKKDFNPTYIKNDYLTNNDINNIQKINFK